MRLVPGRAALTLARTALDDLDAAERILRQPGVEEKPHALRAADTCLDVAQWRLRGVEQIIEAGKA
jgi:hypothetical protein